LTQVFYGSSVKVECAKRPDASRPYDEFKRLLDIVRQQRSVRNILAPDAIPICSLTGTKFLPGDMNMQKIAPLNNALESIQTFVCKQLPPARLRYSIFVAATEPRFG